MKNGFMILLACLALGVQAAPLAERHGAKGMPCASCHGTAAPQPFAEVPNETCLQCHGPKEAFTDKFESKYGKKNPHKNHLGDVACNICHKGHAESEVYCAQCHKDFTLPIR